MPVKREPNDRLACARKTRQLHYEACKMQEPDTVAEYERQVNARLKRVS